MKPRFFHLFRWILVAAVVTSLAAGTYLGQALFQQSQLIEHTYRQGSWGAVQVDSEALKLALALERFRRSRSSEDAQALGLQREIYVSRVLFLRDSAEANQIRSLPQLDAELSSLIGTLGIIDKSVDQVIAGDETAEDALASLIGSQRMKTRDMTQYLLLNDSTLLNRARMTALFEQMIASVLLLLLAGGALVFLAIRQAGAAKASEREATAAREETARQRERLQSALDTSADPFVVSDRDGLVVFANRAYHALLAGEAASAEPGVPLQALLSAEAGMLEDRDAATAAIKADFAALATRAGESFLGHLKDGRTFLYRAHRSSEGGLVLMRTDLTERTRLERERSEFRDQFHHAMKMEAIGRLAGGIAHDFNNVLTAILLSSDHLLLSARTADPSFADLMEIKRNANRAAVLVRQLLAFSRKQTMRPTVLNMTDVIGDLRMLVDRMTGTNVKVEVDYGRDLWPVKSDLGQFEQVLLNLAVNARDAMPEGGTITLRTRNLPAAEVASFGRRELPDDDFVMVEVADQGTGIPPEILDKIFEPFFTTKEVGKGTGLGLSMVYGIIKQSGGYIYPESEVGKGTTFRILLPRHIEVPVAVEETNPAATETAEAAPARVAQTIAAPAAKTEEPADLTGDSAVVLLVEDEEAVRRGGKRMLETRGYTVYEAGSGVEALDIMEELDGAVDIVVSDVVMPEMDGPTLLTELRKKYPDLKFIFVSGYAEDAFARNLPADAKFGFLPKPFSLKQLAVSVREMLDS